MYEYQDDEDFGAMRRAPTVSKTRTLSPTMLRRPLGGSTSLSTRRPLGSVSSFSSGAGGSASRQSLLGQVGPTRGLFPSFSDAGSGVYPGPMPMMTPGYLSQEPYSPYAQGGYDPSMDQRGMGYGEEAQQGAPGIDLEALVENIAESVSEGMHGYEHDYDLTPSFGRAPIHESEMERKLAAMAAQRQWREAQAMSRVDQTRFGSADDSRWAGRDAKPSSTFTDALKLGAGLAAGFFLVGLGASVLQRAFR